MFDKDGKVTRKIDRLPDLKAHQEAAVAASFCAALRRFNGLSVVDEYSLPEADHDASAVVQGHRVQLQLSEIVQREFELPAGMPNRGDPKAIGFFDATSSQGMSLDVSLLNECLVRAIDRKLSKGYAKPAHDRLWLVLFTTSRLITTEYVQDGELAIGEPLRRARECFAARSWHPFDAIWFTDLITRPVRILPC